MVTYDFSAVIGQTLTFNPNADVLAILSNAASALSVVQSGNDLRITNAQGTVTLANTNAGHLTASNVVFPEDGSVWAVGDLTTDDTLDGGDDVLDFTSNSALTDSLTKNNLVMGLGGDDTISLAGGGGNNQVLGGDGSDSVTVGNGNNTLFGGDGVFDASDGDDVFVIGSGSNSVYGNAGNDAVTFSSVTAAGRTFSFFGGGGNDSVTSAAAAGTLLADGGGGDDVLSFTNAGGNNLIYGGLGGDAIDATGSTGDNTIFGGSASSSASDGADIITSGTGNLQLFGNGGGDTVTLNTATARSASVFVGLGDDTITAAATDAAYLIYGGGGADNLDFSSHTGNITLLGGNGTNDAVDAGDTIILGTGGDALAYGNGGNDIITLTPAAGRSARVFGGAGNDTIAATPASTGTSIQLFGNLGDDIFRLDFSGNPATLTVGDYGNGSDIIQTTLSGGASAASLTVSRSASQTVLQNGVNETITLSNFTGNFSATNFSINGGSRLLTNAGGAAATLTGGAGNDQLIAGSNGDTLVAGAGTDLLTGGAGADNFNFAALEFSASDTVSGGAGSNVLVFTAAGASIGDALFVNKTGLNTIKLTAADFAGDTLSLGTNAGAAGVSRVDASALAGSNGSTVDAITLTRALTFNGGTGADSVIGSSFADTLAGAGGDDVLTGGVGSDSLSGGVGDDTFAYGSLAAFISQEGGDRITNFDAGTNLTSSDILRFSADATHYNLGNNDAVVSGAIISSVTAAGGAGTELVVLNTVGIATADITASLNTINSAITAGKGVIDIFFDSTKGHAVVYIDTNGSTAGGHILLADIVGFTTLADMNNFDFGDLAFV